MMWKHSVEKVQRGELQYMYWPQHGTANGSAMNQKEFG